MLEAMRKLALCFVWDELEGDKTPPEDIERWFRHERESNGSRFFPYLVESPGRIERFYTLYADPDDPETAILEGADLGALGDNPTARIPFSKPSGPNSPQLGPVLKRSFSKAKGASPKPKILRSTLEQFKKLSNGNRIWASYFGEVYQTWSRPKLKFAGEAVQSSAPTVLETAIQVIPETKLTTFLTYRTASGAYPGDVPAYVAYLNSVLANTKYATQSVPPVSRGCCPLCGCNKGEFYSNACSGAGINIANIDHIRAFPGFKTENAHLAYALCVDCADLLYIFRYSLLKRLVVRVAGNNALVLPHFETRGKTLNRAFTDYRRYLASLNQGKARTDIEARRLPRVLGESTAVTTIDIIWADFGNKMENIRGEVLDILPSRFRALYELSQEVEGALYGTEDTLLPYAPRHPDERFRFGLNFSFLAPLFHRPGGKKAKQANASSNLFELKRNVIAAIFREETLPVKRFWEEIMTTARWYLHAVLDDDSSGFGILNEGYSEKKNKSWLTLAGWVRHVAVALDYFKTVGSLQKENAMPTFTPSNQRLKEFFQANTGIDTDEKAFAFLLGILFGRVIEIQGAKGVNVSANALTWLKRLTLTGKDLPELFCRIREKLLVYEAEKTELVRNVIADSATLGARIGNAIQLDQVATCYFLLLGQALSRQILAKETRSRSTSDESSEEQP